MPFFPIPPPHPEIFDYNMGAGNLISELKLSFWGVGGTVFMTKSEQDHFIILESPGKQLLTTFIH